MAKIVFKKYAVFQGCGKVGKFFDMGCNGLIKTVTGFRNAGGQFREVLDCGGNPIAIGTRRFGADESHQWFAHVRCGRKRCRRCALPPHSMTRPRMSKNANELAEINWLTLVKTG